MTPDGITQATTIATQYGMDAWSVASNFLVIIILFTAFILFAQYVGRGPFVAILLAFYGSYAIYIAFPYKSYIPSAPPLTALLAHVGLYVAIAVVFYIIMRRVVVSDFLYIGIFGLLALAFLATAFLMALAYHVFLIPSVYTFPKEISMLFAPDQYFFWWFIAPAVGLFFLAR